MNFPKIVALLAGLCLVTAPFAQPDDPALRKEVDAVYAKFDSLVAKGDLDGVMNMLDDSFIQVDADGKTMNKEQARAEFTAGMEMFQSAKSKCVVIAIHDHGTEVVAWITMRVDFKMKQGDKMVPMSFTAQFAETLHRTPQGWKFTYSQMFPEG